MSFTATVSSYCRRNRPRMAPRNPGCFLYVRNVLVNPVTSIAGILVLVVYYPGQSNRTRARDITAHSCSSQEGLALLGSGAYGCCRQVDFRNAGRSGPIQPAGARRIPV